MKPIHTIIDISLPLSPSTIVYPGNPPVEIQSIPSSSGTSWHSQIHMGSHTGTHIDAPRHVDQKGKTLDALPLEHFVGPCSVLDLTACQSVVEKKDLEKKNIQKGDRILCKTQNSLRGFDTFYTDYVWISGDATAYLANKEVSLVGIDFLSIKQKGNPDNTPHTNLLDKDIPILEGIDLSQVEEGSYFLVFLPLHFIDIDGAPGRAILLK